MNDTHRDRCQWIQQAREQQALVQQFERGLIDPQESAVRVQLARDLQNASSH